MQAIHRAIKKHGAENFTFEVIASCLNREDADATEVLVIAQYCSVTPQGYNISLGGGSIPVEFNRLGAQMTNKVIWADPEFRERNATRASARFKRLHAEGKLSPPDWTGKVHRSESKALIGAANAIRQAGEGNSQFGTVWLYSKDEDRSCKVPGTELDSWLKLGWVRGRRMKRKS